MDIVINMAHITLYTTAACPYCAMAKAVLADRDITVIEEIRVDLNDTEKAKMTQLTGRRTVPQIFINSIHIGGYDDLLALSRSGKLDALLAE